MEAVIHMKATRQLWCFHEGQLFVSFKLFLQGNLSQYQIFNTFVFLPVFIFSYFRNSQEPNSSVLADIDLQFVSDELDPIKHLRAIVSGGHISGMMVYPDYFVVLGGRVTHLIHFPFNKV